MGERRVAAPAFTATLSTRYLFAVAGWRAGVRGNWTPALQTLRLVRAAAQASDDTTIAVRIRIAMAGRT